MGMHPTGLISPASSIALLAARKHLLTGWEAGVGDLVTGCHLSIQPDQGDVKLHRWHCGILEALVAVDSGYIEAAFVRLCVSQVVLAEAHAPALQLISISENRSISR